MDGWLELKDVAQEGGRAGQRQIDTMLDQAIKQHPLRQMRKWHGEQQGIVRTEPESDALQPELLERRRASRRKWLLV